MVYVMTKCEILGVCIKESVLEGRGEEGKAKKRKNQEKSNFTYKNLILNTDV